MKILVLDVGGTAIKSAIIDDSDQLSQIRVTPSSADGPEGRIQKAIEIARGYDGFDVVSVAMCGQIDDGAHYREARVFFEGPSAYSSLDYDKNSGHFFLLYEKGDPQKGKSPYTDGLCVAEFDLEWLLQKM